MSAEKSEQVDPVGIVRHRKATTPYADVEQFAQFTRALPPGSFLYSLPPDASVPDAWSKFVLLPLLEAAAAGQTVSIAAGSALRELRAMLAAAPTAPAPIAPDDAELLSAMQENCWKVEPVNIPTGGDDYDIGWRVVEFHLPNVERVMAFSDNADPRTAIRAAMNVLAAAPGVPS